MPTYMETRDLCFEDLIGTLPEVDLYGFLLTVHHTAVLNGIDHRLALPLSEASSMACVPQTALQIPLADERSV